jgi:hypothetical protein
MCVRRIDVRLLDKKIDVRLVQEFCNNNLFSARGQPNQGSSHQTFPWAMTNSPGNLWRHIFPASYWMPNLSCNLDASEFCDPCHSLYLSLSFTQNPFWIDAPHIFNDQDINLKLLVCARFNSYAFIEVSFYIYIYKHDSWEFSFSFCINI